MTPKFKTVHAKKTMRKEDDPLLLGSAGYDPCYIMGSIQAWRFAFSAAGLKQFPPQQVWKFWPNLPFSEITPETLHIQNTYTRNAVDVEKNDLTSEQLFLKKKLESTTFWSLN